MASYNFENINYNDNLYYPRDTVNYLVKGTQTGITNNWTGDLPGGITTYSEGLTIDYYLPQPGNNSSVTLNLGNIGAKPVYLGNSNTPVTNEFSQHSIIRLTYLVNSSLNSGEGCWKASADLGVIKVEGTTGLTGTITSSGSIKANLKSETALTNSSTATTEVADRIYPIALDHDGYLAVNVPWVDTHQTIKQDGVTGATANHYAVCSTAANVAAKTATITTGTPTLEVGLRVIINFTNSNSADSPTLNINELGAKNIFYNSSQITTESTKYLLSGTVEFVYDGTQWQFIGSTEPATYSELGSVKPYKSYSVASNGPTPSISSSAVTVNNITDVVDKYFAVEVDSNGRMFTNVPNTNVQIVDWTVE